MTENKIELERSRQGHGEGSGSSSSRPQDSGGRKSSAMLQKCWIEMQLYTMIDSKHVSRTEEIVLTCRHLVISERELCIRLCHLAAERSSGTDVMLMRADCQLA